MKKSMSHWILLGVGCAVIWVAGTAVPVFAGGEGHVAVGNGGDHVRSTFIAQGREVLKLLKESKTGREIMVREGLDLARLESVLSPRVLRVVTYELKDNTGSVVAAKREGGRILLHRDTWTTYVKNHFDIQYLVFHEMLRAVGKPDDRYEISHALKSAQREEVAASKSRGKAYESYFDETSVGPVCYAMMERMGMTPSGDPQDNVENCTWIMRCQTAFVEGWNSFGRCVRAETVKMKQIAAEMRKENALIEEARLISRAAQMAKRSDRVIREDHKAVLGEEISAALLNPSAASANMCEHETYFTGIDSSAPQDITRALVNYEFRPLSKIKNSHEFRVRAVVFGNDSDAYEAVRTACTRAQKHPLRKVLWIQDPSKLDPDFLKKLNPSRSALLCFTNLDGKSTRCLNGLGRYSYIDIEDGFIDAEVRSVDAALRK